MHSAARDGGVGGKRRLIQDVRRRAAKMQKILLVEDNEANRDMLSRRLVRKGYAVVMALDGHQAVEMANSERPDLILMDIHLPRLSGVDCVRKLKAIEPDLLVLMLTAYEDDDLIFQALKAGANGYLIKQTPPSEILSAIQEVHEGGAPMSSNIARKVIQSFHQTEPGVLPAESLSPREREILDLLARGYMNKEIAESLSIAFQTVHTHVRNIYSKLHVRSRTEAVAKYLRPQ